jgi:hypothetical protein
VSSCGNGLIQNLENQMNYFTQIDRELLPYLLLALYGSVAYWIVSAIEWNHRNFNIDRELDELTREIFAPLPKMNVKLSGRLNSKLSDHPMYDIWCQFPEIEEAFDRGWIDGIVETGKGTAFHVTPELPENTAMGLKNIGILLKSSATI